MKDPESRARAEFDLMAGSLDHAGRLLPFVTVLGYVAGYWILATIAAELGVSVQDLGLGLRDVLLLAGLPAAIWMSGAFVYSSLGSLSNWAEARRKDATGLQAAGFVAVNAGSQGLFGLIALLVAAFTGMDLFATMFVVGLLVVTPSLLRRFPPVGVFVVAVATVVIAGGAVSQAARWASDLKEAAAEGEELPQGPITVRLLLTPSTGTATSDGDSACVGRIGQRVLIGGEVVVVVSDLERFIVEDCKLDARPLAN